jgi:1-deoxy-D-xylulose-5-phosphate reductoisomerase
LEDQRSLKSKLCNVVILGSTGSIGEQALQVVDQHPDRFRVIGLAAGSNLDRLAVQVQHYQPGMVCIGDESLYSQLRSGVGNGTICTCGIEGMCELASLEEADIVLVAVSGSVGIKPTMEAIRCGKRIALANKETLVAAGDIVMAAARAAECEMIPVDSEHSAIFQCLAGEERSVKNLWITASGGPFREFSREALEAVTVEMALAHPNWNMGAKISVDSASMMNKGLEVIEAHHLFNMSYNRIKVLIQRESVIHSMVEFVDGSFIGHMGVADMRIPIQYAMTYPERLNSPAQSLDFSKLSAIHFETPDPDRFPAFRLACEAGRLGGTMPAVMNAANEVAVQRFLEKKITFSGIPYLVEQVMNRHSRIAHPGLDEIYSCDLWARSICDELLGKGK